MSGEKGKESGGAGFDELEKPPYISIWLLPSKEDAERLSAFIAKGAKEFQTYEFLPHLTIISGFHADPEKIEEAMSSLLTAGSKPITLAVDSVETGDKITRTLYIKMTSNEDFRSLCQQYGQVLRGYDGNIPQPHLSLAYKKGGITELGIARRERVEHLSKKVEDFCKSNPELTFDRIALVVSKHTLEKDEDVLDYRVVREFPI